MICHFRHTVLIYSSWGCPGGGQGGRLSIIASLFTITEHMQKSKDAVITCLQSDVEDSNTVRVAVNRPSKQHVVNNVWYSDPSLCHPHICLNGRPSQPVSLFVTRSYSTKLKSERSRSKGPYMCFVVFFHFAAEETKTKDSMFSLLPSKQVLHKVWPSLFKILWLMPSVFLNQSLICLNLSFFIL